MTPSDSASTSIAWGAGGAWVDDGCLVGVDPGGWPEPGPAGVDEDVPGAVFDVAVVVAAEQHSVVLVGSPAVVPAENVVGFAPGNRPVAARPRAAAVAEFQGGAGRAGEQPPGPAQVDDCPGLVEKGGDGLGVAAQVGGQARRDLVPVVQPADAGPVLEGARRDRDDDPGFDPTGGGQFTGGELASAQCEEGVVAALGGLRRSGSPAAVSGIGADSPSSAAPITAPPSVSR